MSDTPSHVERRMLALYAERTPTERLRMASGMFDTGIALMKAGILGQQPDLPEDELRITIFRRLYGDCFSEEELGRIAQFLSRS
ncbi:MAG: hypothetical protein ACYDCO_08860 [Armatimonadota bacterium]